MAAHILYKGWTEPALREALGLTPDGAQDILRYIAGHPRCTSAEIADDLGLKSARSMGPTLTGRTRASEHLQIKDIDGQFHWPLDFPGSAARTGSMTCRHPCELWSLMSSGES